MNLSVECLGGLRIRFGGEPPAFVYRKSRAAIAYMAFSGKAISRATLSSLLWSNLDESRGLANLRVVLSDLRKNIGGVLVTEGDSIWLNPALVSPIDAHRLADTNAMIGAPEFGGDTPKASEIYPGPFLQGFEIDQAEVFDEWITEKRDHFHRLAVLTLQRIAEINLERDRLARAIEAFSILVSLEPWHEDARTGLMIALNRSGNPQAALDEYRKLRSSLESEIGSMPAEATTKLAEEIAQSTLRSVRLERSERLIAPTSPIVAREAELRMIESALTAKLPNSGGFSIRLLTLTGSGGVGKTRIAHQSILRLSYLSKSGSVVVNLSGIESTDEFPIEIARSLQVPIVGLREPIDELCATLADSDALILLDCMEHLLPDVSWMVARLLGECPNLRFIVTSRIPLKIRAENVLVVRPLAVPADDDSIDDLSSFPSVELFLARAASSGTVVPDEELADVAEVCRMLEGLPLAIELCASRIRHFSPREMIDRISEIVSTGVHPDRPERHQSLFKSIEWSYRLLTPDSRRLFRYLGAFPSPPPSDLVDRFILNEIADPESIQELIDSSLIERVRTGSVTRFRLLDTTREFAKSELVSSNELDDANRRLLDGCLELAVRSDVGLRGHDQLQWLERLPDEIDNFLCALEMALVGHVPEALVLACSLSRYWNATGHLSEGTEWICRAIEAGRLASDSGTINLDLQLGNALLKLALLQVRTSDQEKMDLASTLQEATRLLERAGNELGILEIEHLYSLRAQYSLQSSSEEIERTLLPLEDALASLDQSGDIDLLARFELTISSGLFLLDKLDEAYRRGITARDLFARIGSRRGMGMALTQAGIALGVQGDILGSRRLLLESFELGVTVGDTVFLINNLHALAANVMLEWHANRSIDNSLIEFAPELLGAGARLSHNSAIYVPAQYLERLEALVPGPKQALGADRWEAAHKRGWKAGANVNIPPLEYGNTRMDLEPAT